MLHCSVTGISHLIGYYLNMGCGGCDIKALASHHTQVCPHREKVRGHRAVLLQACC